LYKRLSKSNASRDSTNSESSNNGINEQEPENANDSTKINVQIENECSDLTVNRDPTDENYKRTSAFREDMFAVEEKEQVNNELLDEEDADEEGDYDEQNEDEDVNDHDDDEEEDEYYDDEDADVTKKNLFDIYNEYSNELVLEEGDNSAGGVASGSSIVAAAKEKRKYASESTETSSDTSSSGASSAAQNSGSNSGRVDDALSCKNNLELLTKELNKMLDDIETQKFIINDKEIYFLNRIQNFRLLEQIKEEDDEFNEGNFLLY
jgi:hypothetical protein